MVGIFTKILPVAVAGIALFFLANTIRSPTAARETAAAIGETGAAFGTSIGSIGTGVGDFLRSFGSGSAKLLDPFFSLKTLLFEEDTSSSNTNRSLPNPNISSVAGSYAAAAGPSSEGTTAAGASAAAVSSGTTPGQSFSGGYTSKPSHGWGG
jgi:hypothetical protein|tara:strand:- start:87 stop:545 length:459 start_codon:yes stop_codon:yes gene_type:complete